MNKIKIKYTGPFNDKTGLGQASRNLIEILKNSGLEYGLTGRSLNEEKDQTIKDIKIDDYNINLFFCPPYMINSFLEENEDVVNVCYTMWETNNIPDHFINNVNKLDCLIVPTKENSNMFKRTTTPIEVLPCAYYSDDMFSYDNTKENMFTFYSIFDFSERKSPLELMIAYLSEFTYWDNVNFVLKTNCNRNWLDMVKINMKLHNYPNLKFINDNITRQDIVDMHKKYHCYISVSRGEGWNLPMMDAALFGNLVISTKTGCIDYIDSSNLFLVNGEYAPVVGMSYFVHFNASQEWIMPSIKSIKQQMRHAYNLYNKNIISYDDTVENIQDLKDNLSINSVSSLLKDIFQNL